MPDSSVRPEGRGDELEGSQTVLRNPGSSARRPTSPPAGPTTIPLPAPGEMVGTFRLEEAIGAGGMGAVYRALDTQLDRQVALKLLPPDQAADPEVVLRFYQEGRSAAQLDHENIARVYSIGQDGAFHHIAFEYIDGVTLRHRVESSGPLTPGEAVDVALQIANALVHASRRGVVHRDIKPSNIILTPQGRAKVVDMGLARRFERGGDHGLTQSGMTLGTFDYISPEQARDPRDVDVRSDLYSLGCTMFHMLTGRPPFPGGTVLQKLIQHQEEPPADVRTLNPDVPAELSAIIAKLMAKDRDRRYQGPENLVRDLLPLASSLGYERPPSEFEPWMLHAHHTWWERHVVWLLPALGFVVVIAGLVWWGRDVGRPRTDARGQAGGPPRRPDVELKIAESPGPVDRTSPVGPSTAEGRAAIATAFPLTIPVSSKEDLHAVLASAPPGSAIILADDGPYRLSGRPRSLRDSKALAEADLTIRAENGVRPVLKWAEGAGDEGDAMPSLLRFIGGRVVLERIEFELDATARDSEKTAAAIRCEDTELTLRGCMFRRPSRAGQDGRDSAAVVIRAARSGPRGAERPPAVFAEACHFDGGQVAIRAQGPVDVTLRDCTMGPASPSIWFDGTRSECPVPGELRLIHTSILAGTGPVFRFDGGPVRARVDDCVIAAAGRTPSALVQVLDSKDLSWRGRSNLYGSIGSFLTTTGRSAQPTTLRDLAAWEGSGTEPREQGSRTSDAPVWEAADPLAALAQERDNPTRVFLLASRVAESSAGARHGPFGASLENVRSSSRPATPRPPQLASNRPDITTKGDSRPESPPRADRGRARTATPAEGAPGTSESESSLASTDPMDLPAMPPMATSGTANAEMGTEPVDEPVSRPPVPPQSVRTDATRATEKSSTSVPSNSTKEEVVRTSDSFLAALRRGGTVRVAAGADLELPAIGVAAATSTRVQVIGETGGARPRLRFLPSPSTGASPTDWLALITIRSGSLRLQGLDLVVPEAEVQVGDRLAAIAVLPGTELVLDDCTVTVAARGPATAAIVVPPTGGRAAVDSTSADAVIEVRDGFLRSGGDAVLVAGGARLALKLQDVMVATEGSLLRAQGSARGPSSQGESKSPLTVRIEKVSARVKGGLVHLQTTREEPEMAAVDLRAVNSILSTVTGDHPLFRLEGQDHIERLRDKIRWIGHRIAYHHIKTYRRDEIAQAGVLPRIFDRDDWMRAFLPADDEPILTDLKFRQQADASEPAWKVERDDLTLAASGLSVPLGPDSEKIPDPPPSDEES